jgi:hypothetical protein
VDAAVEPLLAVADLDRSVAFWVEGVGGRLLTRWDTYAHVGLGRGGVHLAPPAKRRPTAPYGSSRPRAMTRRPRSC